MRSVETCDVAIVGGGLAGGLIAYALDKCRPELTVRLIERGPIGGNHVWSFFAEDIAPADRWIIEPFVSLRWDGYDVAFPHHRRTLDMRYNSILSNEFAVTLRRLLARGVLVEGKVLAASPTAVVLADGRRIEAKGVIDTRGAADLGKLAIGWQKFVGQELKLDRPHGLRRPIVMDATVDQIDGYRFVYVLPFAPDRLFVEDTYYSDGDGIDEAAIAGRIAAYSRAAGWQVASVERSESGALPVVLGGDFEAYWLSGGKGVAKAGVRGALFHPTTGYSLPDAVRTAALLVRTDDVSGPALHDRLHAHAAARWKERGFYRLLDRMLFQAARPEERYRVLERFYRLAPSLIGRFYAARSTALDKARILAGKPPVPILRAFDAIRETAH